MNENKVTVDIESEDYEIALTGSGHASTVFDSLNRITDAEGDAMVVPGVNDRKPIKIANAGTYGHHAVSAQRRGDDITLMYPAQGGLRRGRIPVIAATMAMSGVHMSMYDTERSSQRDLTVHYPKPEQPEAEAEKRKAEAEVKRQRKAAKRAARR